MEFINPLAWMRWFGEFFRAWMLALPWRDAPKAIPAIILLIVMIIVGAMELSDGAGLRNRLVHRQYKNAMEKEDYETAELVVRRQLEANPNDGDLVFRLALARKYRGFHEDAHAIMNDLANRRQHLGAAKWIFREKYFERDPKVDGALTEEEFEEYGMILDVILEQERENNFIKERYATYLIAKGKFASAIPILKELAPLDPMRGLQAAALSRRLGDHDGANMLAESALNDVSKMSHDDPTNAVLALAVAQNQIFLKRFGDAARTLDRAVNLAKTKEEKAHLSQAMGDTIVAWITHIEQSPTNTIQDRLRVLKMLRAALNYAPNNPRVVTMVADQVLKTLDQDDEELSVVRNALVSGSSPGIAHFIRGTSALMNEDIANAMLHLELASELMPQSGAVLNNLAVAMALRKDPDLEMALKISNAAIEQTERPTPHFYETRGQILYQLGSFKAAVPDLERSLAEPKLAKKGHEMLAVCYDRVGDRELANAHRARAKTESESTVQGADKE